MARRTAQRFEFDALGIDPVASEPLYRQLETQLRDAIRDGRLKPGERLPSTRGLSTALDVARNTVSAAYEQLSVEGYLESEIGSGTRVSRRLPDQLLQVPRTRHSPQTKTGLPGLSKRGRRIAEYGAWITAANDGPPRPFRPHVPALDVFPRHIWQRLSERRLRRLPRDLLSRVDSLGFRPLREAIAEYLGIVRGVRCTADQVAVTAGAQQGIDLLSRLLLDQGSNVWVEEPGYTPASQVFELAGAEIVPVPVDEEGLSVAAGTRIRPDAQLAYVTPSSHWPLGITMSLPRRMELLDWARRHHSWIIEDDYNGEYRYHGRPLPALQGLDESGSVIYMGTFSKVLFPSLRLGYLVVPERLIEGIAAARWLADRHSPPFEQAVLTDFIEGGHFARHVRQMRTLYASRKAALMDAIAANFGSAVNIAPRETGMHVVADGTDALPQETLVAAAIRAGLDFHLVADYSAGAHPRPSGMILGFSAYSEDRIQSAVRAWAANGSW